MRFIVLMLLAIMSSGAVAQLVKAGSAPGSGGYDFYADPATIRKSGDIVKMSGLDDFKTEQVSPSGKRRYLSEKWQREYDCKDERYKMLNFSWHSENMGKGDTVYRDDDVATTWRPVSPGSVAKILWNIACGKK